MHETQKGKSTRSLHRHRRTQRVAVKAAYDEKCAKLKTLKATAIQIDAKNADNSRFQLV